MLPTERTEAPATPPGPGARPRGARPSGPPRSGRSPSDVPVQEAARRQEGQGRRPARAGLEPGAPGNRARGPRSPPGLAAAGGRLAWTAGRPANRTVLFLIGFLNV